ncbi:MAG: YkgJ family cysteine cluster protein [Terracidiphilus sp.]
MPLPAGDSQLVQIVDASLAEAARRAGPWLACRPGCTQCCHGAFAINALDVLRLRAGMEELRTNQPALAASLERRARAWLTEHLPDFPGDPVTGLLGDSEADQARFEDFANEAPCPALDPATGLCDVYAWRPMTCRVFGPPIRMAAADNPDENHGDALGCCDLCFIGATEAEIAACEMPIPHALESSLLDQTGQSGETIVAFALLP